MSDAQRRLLTLLALALLLVTGLLLIPPPAEEAEDGWSAAFPGLVLEELRALELSHGELSLRLEPSAEGWVLTVPVSARAHPAHAQALVDAAAGLELRSPVEGAAPIAYGIGPEEVIEVVLTDGEHRRRSFRVGAEAAVGTATYVFFEGQVRPARGLLRQSFTVTLDELRAPVEEARSNDGEALLPGVQASSP